MIVRWSFLGCLLLISATIPPNNASVDDFEDRKIDPGSLSRLDLALENSTIELIDYIKAEADRNETRLAWNWLAEIVDDFGHRLLGSQALEASIDFVTENLKKDGFDNVHTEDVPDMPHWERGNDVVTILEPRLFALNILAVSGTDPANVTGEVVVVTCFEELASADVAGKIVLLNPQWKGYFGTVGYRRAADRIERAGGIGLLVKSIGPFSIGSPHTGSGSVKKSTIPAVCLTIEEAELLERFIKRGKKVVVNMDIKSHNVGTMTSRNIVFDLRGSEKPDEVVMLTGHIDSWDVGQGALDDGGGMAAVWQAMLMIKRLAAEDPAFRPKRTIRGIFWTAEEQGLLGAKHYFNEHKNGSETFFFVSETDQGAFRSRSLKSKLNFKGCRTSKIRLQQIANVLTDNDVPVSVIDSNLQGDVQFWADDGVPSANYVSDQGEDYYFYFHHTRGDYMTIFKDDDIQYTAIVFAALAHVLANIQNW